MYKELLIHNLPLLKKEIEKIPAFHSDFHSRRENGELVTCADLITYSCSWYLTPQGDDFWVKIYTEYERVRINWNIPQ